MKKNNTIVIQIHLDKRVLVGLAMLAVLLGSYAVWADIQSTLPYEFEDGDIISAEGMQSNFDTLIANDAHLMERIGELENVTRHLGGDSSNLEVVGGLKVDGSVFQREGVISEAVDPGEKVNLFIEPEYTFNGLFSLHCAVSGDFEYYGI